MPASHRTAAILSIGDELTLGQTLDTNARWLSARLVDLGILPTVHITIPDDRGVQARALTELARAHGLIICTGGLGPTDDDLTRHALADALGEPLTEDTDALETLRVHALQRHQELTPGRRLQALRPVSARMLPNRHGTAPGLAARLHHAEVFCLPGPPGEMRPMFEASVVPAIHRDPTHAITTRVLHTFGLPEADIAHRLGALMARGNNPQVGTTASGGIVSVRIRYEGDPDAAERAIADIERTVDRQLAPHVFGADDDSLASVVVRMLTQRQEKLVTIESCTGGGVASAITALPGSSTVFDTGFVTYANETKTLLADVPRETLEAHGAVSEQTARAMAEGALDAPAGASAHHALALTGIAGPGGATPVKPVGTVFIARASRGGASFDTEVRRFLFSGDRAAVRERSVAAALAMLCFALKGAHIPRLIWQTSLDDSAAPSPPSPPPPPDPPAPPHPPPESERP